MSLQKITENTDIQDQGNFKDALIELAKLPDSELHYYLVLRDTLQATSANTRKSITLAQVELERRKAKDTRNLAVITTLFSGAIGIFGVALGACLAQMLDAPRNPTHVQLDGTVSISRLPSGDYLIKNSASK